MADSHAVGPRRDPDAAKPLNRRLVCWEGQTVAVSYPDELAPAIDFAADGFAPGSEPPLHSLEIRPGGESYDLCLDDVDLQRSVTAAQAVRSLIDELVRCLITGITSGVVIHAGCLSKSGYAVLLAGGSGAGKSSLAAFLAGRSFDYRSDEATVLSPDAPMVTAMPRPIVIKDGEAHWIADAGLLDSAKTVAIGPEVLVWPQTRQTADEHVPCRLCLFPQYLPESPLRIKPLSAADTALALTGLNVNARNLEDHGFATITGFARSVVGFEVHYSDFNQLDGVAELLGELAASRLQPDAISRLASALDRKEEVAPHIAPTTTSEEQVDNTTFAPTPAIVGSATPPVLTIGMATYDDYDGAYFTLQSLRLFHPEVLDRVEFVVVDNNPRGPCAKALKALEHHIRGYRYVPHETRRSNAAKTVVFEEAAADIVLCLDSHVLVAPGAVQQLIDYVQERGGERDLWHGPLIYDDLTHISTHLSPEWSGGMFGCWATDDRGIHADAEPFEIGMQGMGLFACRRDAWPGFNTEFKGFAVEEGYIHEKVRQSGGRVFCLPFLRWIHRFNRPMGVPYQNVWEDRVRNYVIGYRELGLEIDGIEQHFTELLGPGIVTTIQAAQAEADRLSGKADADIR